MILLLSPLSLYLLIISFVFLSPPSLQIVLLFPLQTRSTSFLSLSNRHGDNPIRSARFQFWVNISFGNGFQFLLGTEVRWVSVVLEWVVVVVMQWVVGFARWWVCCREGGVGNVVVKVARSACCEFV